MSFTPFIQLKPQSSHYPAFGKGKPSNYPPSLRTKVLSATLLVIASILSASCSLHHKDTRSLDEIKSGLICVEYKDNMTWQGVEQLLGEADAYPPPSENGGKLSKNSRIYYRKDLIFYTERQRVEQEGKVRFQEVVTKVEVCRPK